MVNLQKLRNLNFSFKKRVNKKRAIFSHFFSYRVSFFYRKKGCLNTGLVPFLKVKHTKTTQFKFQLKKATKELKLLRLRSQNKFFST